MWTVQTRVYAKGKSKVGCVHFSSLKASSMFQESNLNIYFDVFHSKDKAIEYRNECIGRGYLEM
jgi:hypothetical protein